MDFEVPEEAQEAAKGLNEFIDRFVIPLEEKNADLLATERSRYDDTGRFRPEVLELRKQVRIESAKAGFYTMFGDPELGGGGLTPSALVHVQEELTNHVGPSRPLIHENVVPSVFTNGLSPLLLHLQPQVRDKYVAGIGSGEKTFCFGLSEPGAGSDVQRIRTKAVKDGTDWIINGTKQWISNAPYADYCVLFAVTDPEANKARRGGITAFFIDTSWDGFDCSGVVQILGHSGTNIGILTLENLRVPEEHIVGELHNGLALALLGISRGRLSMSALCIGTARWALAQAVEYAKQRETFGKPIGEHQAVQMMLAEMAMDIYAAKATVARTAWMVESGRKSIKETSITKALCTEMLGRVTDTAMQVHGGMGLTNELRIEEAWRHARALRIPDGTAEIQRRTIAMRLLRGDTDL